MDAPTSRHLGYAKVLAEARCRMCDAPRDVTRRTGKSKCIIERHHLVAQADGGPHYEPNIVPVCKPCHVQLHLPDQRASERLPARRRLREVLSVIEEAFVIGMMGEEWFADQYPQRVS